MTNFFYLLVSHLPKYLNLVGFKNLRGFFNLNKMRRLQLLPIAIFALFFFLMNWYILGGLQVVASQNYVPAIFWFVVITTTFSLLYAIQDIQSR